MVNGTKVAVSDPFASLLDVLREQLRLRSVKDGCSPQGQCGCCTVLIDGQPRVACVTPARRVQGRNIVTLEGLDPAVREGWSQAFSVTGASQCGFCTPGIICRFSALHARGKDHSDRHAPARALAAHLCRCTGWQPILDAWVKYPRFDADHGSKDDLPKCDLDEQRRASEQRAAIEGHVAQSTGPHVALGAGGFADDTAPEDALVAIRRASGVPVEDLDSWVVAETAAEARRLAARPQGRRTTLRHEPPLEVPPGEWAVTLRTSWVEPGYLETDASWCEPGGEPASPLGNAGAFGAKADSPLPGVARRLADLYGRSMRVLWSRPDTVECGPKRPPIAAGVRADGTGEIVIARTPQIADIIKAYAPGLAVTEVDVAGPQTSAAIRGAGWVEAAVLLAAVNADSHGWITSPDGGAARASVAGDGTISVEVRAGKPLDEVVLRSYCTGAAHMAYSWVTSESLAIDLTGRVHDLTVRSFGIIGAAAMPPVKIKIIDDGTEPVNGSDAVFAAVAAATWINRGCPETWPTGT